MTIRSRNGNAVVKPPAYQRIYVGEAQFTDDPNDDWFAITFNGVWIGDYTPNAIYIHKSTGKVKIMEDGLWVRLLHGLTVSETLRSYKFDKHHRLILEKFAKDSFAVWKEVFSKTEYKCFISNMERLLDLSDIDITMNKQRT